MINLAQLSLSNNELTGVLPESLTQLRRLVNLRFANNSGLCAPDDSAFQTWIGKIANSFGDDCPLPRTAGWDDRATLIALYNATGGANWANNTNWLSDGPLGDWYGVTTDANGSVTELILGNNQLTGTLPVELGNLANLKTLFFRYNQLTGTIPTELGNLTHLRWLDLSINELSGTIPTELGKLGNLTIMNLYDNHLTGTLPVELGSLVSLTTLSLRNNQITGFVPAELGKLNPVVAGPRQQSIKWDNTE